MTQTTHTCWENPQGIFVDHWCIHHYDKYQSQCIIMLHKVMEPTLMKNNGYSWAMTMNENRHAFSWISGFDFNILSCGKCKVGWIVPRFGPRGLQIGCCQASVVQAALQEAWGPPSKGLHVERGINLPAKTWMIFRTNGHQWTGLRPLSERGHSPTKYEVLILPMEPQPWLVVDPDPRSQSYLQPRNISNRT